MAARRETGTPNLANHLATTHPLTRPDQIARSVVEGSLHSDSVDGAVADKEPIAIRGIGEGSGDHTRVRCTNGCAASGGEVSAVMQLPDLELADGAASRTWMSPNQPPGGESRDCPAVQRGS